MNLKEAIAAYGYAALVTMLLIGSLVLESDVYVCEGNSVPVRECIKLSSSNRTCYYETGRDLCSNGVWKLVRGQIATGPEIMKVYANGKEWNCTINERNRPYSQCLSGSRKGYLGELI